MAIVARVGLAGVVLLAANVALATPLYVQPNDRAPQPSFFSDAVPGQFFSQRMADDFMLAAPGVMTGVRWWGGSQNFLFRDLANMQSFTVLVFTDTEGSPDPGALLASKTVSVANSNAAPTGLTIFNGGSQFEHSLVFDAPVALSAGQRYWISIGATLNDRNGDAWVWSGSTVGDLVNATDTFNGSGFHVYDPTFNDLAFEIIPEPGSAVLLVVGVALAGLRERRPGEMARRER